MRATQCLYNSRRALYRVFISPAERAEAQLVPRQLLHVPTASCSRSYALLSVRAFATARRAPRKPAEQFEGGDKEPAFDKRFTTAEAIARSGRSRPPQDHEITDPRIMVIDNGATEGPLSTRFVMSKLEPGESLRMIEPYKPADREKGTREQYAVCKIVNKRDEYVRQREIKERKRAEQQTGKAASKKLKELEITWTIGEHDLLIKLRQMGGFLDKGMKVELAIGKKKRGREASAEEAREVLRKVREEIEAQGYREAKPATGNAGGAMKLYLEGKQVS